MSSRRITGDGLPRVSSSVNNTTFIRGLGYLRSRWSKGLLK